MGVFSLSGEITNLGKIVVALPFDPHIGKMIVIAMFLGCLDSILVFIGMQSLGSLFLNRAEGRQSARDVKKAICTDVCSDQIAMIRIYHAFLLKFSISRQEVVTLLICFFLTRSWPHL